MNPAPYYVGMHQTEEGDRERRIRTLEIEAMATESLEYLETIYKKLRDLRGLRC